MGKKRSLSSPFRSFILLIRALIFVFAVISSAAEIPSKKEVKIKSLFDDLPLNGALPTNLQLNPEEFSQVEHEKENRPETENVFAKGVSKQDGTKSLFDQLPDQGAMDSTKFLTSKLPENETDSNPRAQRHSLSSELSPPSRFGEEFEIEHKPATDLNLSFFNNNLLPPILRSLTQEDQRTSNSQYGAPSSHSTIPILSNPNSGSSNSGYDNNLPNVPTGAEPGFRGVTSNSFSSEKYSVPVRLPDSGYKGSSGASIVIGQSNSGFSAPSSDYGPPRDTPKEQDSNSKSEVHYHYHINTDKGNKPPNSPSVSYGQPEPPVRTSHETTRVRRPPGNVYLPPRSEGYSEAPQDTPGAFPPAPPSFDEETPGELPPPQDTPGGYGPAPQGQSRPRPPKGSSRPRPGLRPRPPSHGNSRPRPGISGHRPRPPSQGYAASGTSTQADEEFQERTLPHPEDFQSRTLLTNHDSRHLSRPGTGSSQYGVPSTSYGPPPPVYGPPDNTPPAPNDQGVPAQALTQLTQTSITLETIPITTTETRLITVPKITQTLGSSQPQFDSAAPPPNSPPISSGGYGSGGQSSSFLTGAGPPAPPQSARNILNEQLLQLSPSPSRLSDLSDIDLIALLQSQDNPRDILTPQQRGSIFGSNFRTNGQDFRSSGSQNLGFNLRDLQLGNGGSGYNNLRGTSPLLTSDTVGALSDLIREQRLQQAGSDLRQRPRLQNRDADRARQAYRNLFYKGALLLGGLSLIPTVANVGGSAAGSSLLPLAGRKKRSVENGVSIRTCLELPPLVIPMPQNGSQSLSILTVRRRNCKDPGKKVTFRGSLKKQGKTDSLLDSMPFKGAMVPPEVQGELQRFLPMDEILQNSQCIQRYFCENILEIEALKKPEAALLLLSALTSDVDKNPWLKEAMTAAKNRQCGAFYCHATTPPMVNPAN